MQSLIFVFYYKSIEISALLKINLSIRFIIFVKSGVKSIARSPQRVHNTCIPWRGRKLRRRNREERGERAIARGMWRIVIDEERGRRTIHICRSEICKRWPASILGSKLLSHILDNWPCYPLLPPFFYHYTSVGVCGCRISPTPVPSRPADTISCRLNRAVMVRTLYCFILFPSCLYYMARAAISSSTLPLFSFPFFLVVP